MSQKISGSVGEFDDNLAIWLHLDRNRDHARLEDGVVLDRDHAHLAIGVLDRPRSRAVDFNLGRCWSDIGGWVMPEDNGEDIANILGIVFVVGASQG